MRTRHPIAAAGLIQGACIDGTDLHAWSSRDPHNNRVGLGDPDARVGRGKKCFYLGYKAHVGLAWNSELPVSYRVASANRNERDFFKPLSREAKQAYPNALWHVADTQYTSHELRRYVREELNGIPVIPKTSAENRGEDDIWVDKKFRVHGNPTLRRRYKKQKAAERMNSRAETLAGRNTLRGQGKVRALVGLVLTLMNLIATASYNNGKPELARSITYYSSH